MKKHNYLAKIIMVYNIIFILLGVVFYFVSPRILNFPPYSINNEFERSIDSGLNFYQQYIIGIIALMFIGDVFIYFSLKGIGNYTTASKEELEKITRKCFTIPYTIYIVQTLLPSIIITVLLYLTETKPILILKTISLIFTFSTLVSLISYLYAKKVLKHLLFTVTNLEAYKGKLHLNFNSRIILQFFPLIVVAILFPSVAGYSSLNRERGELIFEQYQYLLNDKIQDQYNTLAELLLALKDVPVRNEQDNIFIVDIDKNVHYSENTELSEFFVEYMFQVSDKLDGHVYDYWGSDTEGIVVKKVFIDGIEYYVGVIYPAYSYSGMVFLLISVILILGGCIAFLLYFSKDIATDISNVSEMLSLLSTQSEIDYDKKIPVTSNDEIGELIVSFNKILDLEKHNMETISRNQEIMVEQERLSSLGQLIGGIAHNLKTPIMSIAGAVEGLTDLIKEYDESVEDSSVTPQDHHEIAHDMQEWVDKIRPYLGYMTEVIDTVKGQAVSMNATTMECFSAKELMSRTQILLRDELKRRHCTLNLKFEGDENSNIAGEISAIVQVIDNLIINAMDAYKDKPGTIDIFVHEDAKKIYIDVKDYAGGIPEHVQERLFKEMITSKGKNGTGLGLYMSYSTIKGKFNGDMRYETKIGEGTTFFIELNKYKGKNN